MKVEKLVVGIIGLGMGKMHLKGAIEYGAEIGAICDINVERLNAIGEELNIPEERRTTNYFDIVINKEINTVVVATWDQLHRGMIEALLSSGKNVLCEKPLALTREDVTAIVKAVEAHPECKFMIGQVCRFAPAFVKAKEIIDSGKIGEIYFVESEYAHDYYKMYRDYYNKYKNKQNWRTDPIRNGVIGGGCHAVDLIRWLVNDDPTEVYAYGTHKLLTQYVPYHDSNLAMMKFPNDVMGKVFVSTGCKRNYTMRTCVYGTKGTLIFDNQSETMQAFYVNEENIAPHDPEIIPVEVNSHNAAAEFACFADALVNDLPIDTSVYEGAKTVEVCLAIVESANEGKIVYPDYNFN